MRSIAESSLEGALDRAAAAWRLARAEPVAAGTTAVLLTLGVGGALAGSAWGAVPIAAAIGTVGWVDRRAPAIVALLLLPTLTVFNPLEAFQVAGSTIDFRLLLTGGLAAALGLRALADRVHPDAIGWLLVSFLGLQVLLVSQNDVAPLRAIAPIARTATWMLTYLLVLANFGRPSDLAMVPKAIVAGAAVPALMGLLQWAAGLAVEQNDAARLTSVYLTSPVGLALALQLAGLTALGLADASGGATRVSGRSRIPYVAVVLAYGLVLLRTATRLTYVTFVAGAAALEVLRGRWRAVPIIILVGVVALASQPDFLGRLLATGAGTGPVASPTVSSPEPSTDDGARPPPTPATGPPDSPAPSPRGDDTAGMDTSLRFRLFLWSTMAEEWSKAPILGHGTGSFAAILEIHTGLERVAPHNDYLGILFENGAVGLLLYVALQSAVVVRLARSVRSVISGSRRTLMSLALVAFAVTNILNAISNPMLYLDLQVSLWALVAVGIAAAGAKEPGVLATPKGSASSAS